jgi:hypothetical protein
MTLRMPMTPDSDAERRRRRPRAGEQDEDGLWRWIPATFDDERHAVTASVDRLGAWAVVPGGLLAPWQQRRLIGAPFEPGRRNALIIHGWNARRGTRVCWPRAQSAARCERVLAYAYPSALDIAASGAWLRDDREAIPRSGVRRHRVQRGGLVARVAVEPGRGTVDARSVRPCATCDRDAPPPGRRRQPPSFLKPGGGADATRLAVPA